MRAKTISELEQKTIAIDDIQDVIIQEVSREFTKINLKELALKYIEANKNNEAFVKKVVSILNIDANIKKDFINGEQSIGIPYDKTKLDLNR